MLYNYNLLITIHSYMFEEGEREARLEEGGERKETRQRVERSELYTYICRILYIYPSK